MKGLGALQRHQLPHPLAKILDPPLIDSLPPSLSICAISESDPLSLPVPPTWGATVPGSMTADQSASALAMPPLPNYFGPRYV